MTGRHAPGYPPEPVWFAELRVHDKQLREHEEALDEAPVDWGVPSPQPAAAHVNARGKKHQ